MDTYWGNCSKRENTKQSIEFKYVEFHQHGREQLQMHSSALILCTLTCNLQDPISSGRKIDKGFLCTSSQRAKALSIVIASDCSLILCWSFKIMSTFFWFLLGFWWKLIPPHWLKRGHFMLIHWFMGWDLPRISWNIERYQNIKSYTVNWTSNMDFTGIVVGSPSSQPSRSPHLSWWISTGKFLDSATWTRSHPKD